MSPVLAVTLLVALQRLSELAIARRNTARLLARGAVEHGAGHYPLIVLLHLAWLASLPLVVPADRWPDPWLLGAYLLLQPLRYWCIASLDGYWTTRVVVLPGSRPVARGPYRWLNHPNYLVVAAEIALLPLAFGAWAPALLFSVLNAALLLGVRIPCERRARAGLAGRPG
ncbi:MAG: isoprenylcysteine carboxylmethyltransferase family protein [Geminicoccaceae bacterium]